MTALAPADIALIVMTCLLCAALVAIVAVAILRTLRRRTLMTRLLVVACAGTVAMTASVLAISVEMYISEHDLTVLVVVLAVSLVLGVLVAMVVARAGRASFDRLSASLERVGGGAVVEAEDSGWDEVDELSAQLAAVSAKIESARDELAQLDSARRRFFAWISHDLRTPLTAVRALAETIEEGASDAPERFAGEVRAQVETMSRMVDDLFELSKLTSGAVRLRTEQVGLREVVSDAVADVRAAAELRGLRIVERGIAGQVLWADPHQLGRIVVNLLTNAIRHAPPGTDIVISATETDGRRLVLGILDRGSGVAAWDLDRMFDVGWRGDPARGPAGDGAVSSGAGLGLSIARGLARAHGGDVTAELTDDGFRMNVLIPYPDAESS